MPVHDDLGKRMKEFYEQVPKTKLVRRMPVAIRIDGKAFHTFTKGFKKPFDDLLMDTMHQTTKYLCENIQGCVLGYTQSDEITLILVDYKNLNSSAWFDYEVQKMCSISASMATMAFNKIFQQKIFEMETDLALSEGVPEDVNKLLMAYLTAMDKGAMFDARVFNIPKEEVTNLIYWRQLDATRNSIQMVGQANFSHKELQGKSCNEIQDILHEQKGINWNNYLCSQKRGTCVIKQDMIKLVDGNLTTRSEWFVDLTIPVFKGEDRKYIDKLIMFEGEE